MTRRMIIRNAENLLTFDSFQELVYGGTEYPDLKLGKGEIGGPRDRDFKSVRVGI